MISAITPRRHLLFVTQLLPYPPNSGGKVKTLKVLQLLSRMFRITLCCFYDTPDQQHSISYLKRELGAKVLAFYRPEVTARHSLLKKMALRSLLSTRPFSVYKYYDQRMHQSLIGICQSDPPDIIYFDHDTSLQYLPMLRPVLEQVVTVYDEHNISSFGQLRRATYSSNPLYTLFYIIDARKLRWYERQYIPHTDQVLAISTTDANQLKALGVPPARLKYLPLPFQVLSPSIRQKYRSPALLFLGTLSWPPNKHGLLWFVRRVWPLVLDQLPQTKLLIVGTRAEKEIAALHGFRNIKLVGPVKNVVPYLQRSHAMVVPILSGSGVRIKILDALVAGLPVVSTTIGAEGLPKLKSSGVITADQPDKFAQQITKLLNSTRRQRQLSAQGRRYIRANFLPEKTQRVLSEALS